MPNELEHALSAKITLLEEKVARLEKQSMYYFGAEDNPLLDVRYHPVSASIKIILLELIANLGLEISQTINGITFLIDKNDRE